MKILYCGLLYNYGKQEEGFSYEHMNIEAGLADYCQKRNIDLDLYYPDVTKDLLDNYIRAILNGEYSAIFHVAFNEHIDLPEQIALMALKQDVPVIQWDCDSSWRFHNWILSRKQRASHFVTTHSATIPWYEQNGMKVIKSQWAGSPLYTSDRNPYKYDVTFVGQKHGQMPNGKFLRSEIIDAIIQADITIDLFGNYWDGYTNWHGYQTRFENIIKVFNTSKINLNLSNAWHYGTMPQIKGRHFEIPQCHGFQISTPADDLTSYFIPDKEIIIANSVEDLIDKTRHYLNNSVEREQIAAAGHRRMLKDHQWSNRFDHIFKECGVI
jgi:hypothetical protein